LSELDYRRFSLTIDNQRWRCCIEPWAASEVVCKCRRCAAICASKAPADAAVERYEYAASGDRSVDGANGDREVT
jgi:hypothetical protein